MAIGGRDIVLIAPRHICHGDIILRACQRMWDGYECVFMDVETTQLHSLRESWVWLVGSGSPDFFVFRDRAAADSRVEEGAVEHNSNTMLQFIIALRHGDDATVDVALVFDRSTRQIAELAKELSVSFVTLASLPLHRGAA